MSTFFNRSRFCFNKHAQLARGLARRSLSRGFTLVELVVVVGVITVITGFLLFNQNKFNSSTLLRSLAYSVALSIRQAQLYGVSVRGFGTGSSASFAPGYGVYFLGAAPTQNFSLFADVNNNAAYDAGEALSGVGGVLVSVGRGYSINKFCAVSSGGVQDCYPSGGSGGTLSSLTLYFRRPNPDATFSAVCTGTCASSYTNAYIQVQSAGGTDTRSIKVTNTGQITVCPLNTEPPSC